MKVGFGIGIEYPNISTLSGVVGCQEEDNGPDRRRIARSEGHVS